MFYWSLFRSTLLCVSSLLLLLLATPWASAQDIVDGFTRGAGNTDIAIGYQTESYNKFYVGDQEMDLPPPLGKITVTSLNFYLAHGITNDIDLVASLPRVSASAAGDGTGPPDQSGIQDGTLMLKWRPWQAAITQSITFDMSTAIGVRGPLSDYVSNAPVAIGHRSTDVELRAIGLLRFSSGPFASLSLGYSRRDGIVPDAALVSGSIGYAADKIYVEGWIFNQNSQSGTDIGDTVGFPTLGFPSNRINFLRVGLKGAYSFTDWLAVSIGGAITLNGRNVGKATGIGGGVVVRMQELSRTLVGR